MAITIQSYEDLIKEVEEAPSLYAIEVLIKNCLDANLIHFESDDDNPIEVLKIAKENIINDLIKYQNTETPIFFLTSIC